MKRREFITLIGGTVLVGPADVHAQPSDRIRRVSILMPSATEDTEAKTRVSAFLQRLQELGWSDGRNVRIEQRWAEGSAANIRKFIADVVALAPDVILTSGSFVAPTVETVKTVPIVFVNVIDPVGRGLVESLARPGSNATDFTLFEYSLSAKWAELLKDVRDDKRVLDRRSTRRPAIGTERMVSVGPNTRIGDDVARVLPVASPTHFSEEALISRLRRHSA
jgi:putative ABC transport system substrate-binding protein